MSDLVSIIVPVYNIEEYLGNCLESLVNQTYDNLEIILVNDGSTDGSLALCKDFQSEHDNIILYSQDNAGAAAARNQGLKIATGKYITFVDGDDYLDVNFCKTMIGYLKRFDLDVVVGNLMMTRGTDQCGKSWVYEVYNTDDGHDTYLGRILNTEELLEAYCSWVLFSGPWCKMYKKCLFDTYGILFPLGTYNDDALPSLQILSHCQRGYITSDPRASYFNIVQRPNSISVGNFFYSTRKLHDRYDAYFRCLNEMQKYLDSGLLKKQFMERYAELIGKRLVERYTGYQALVFEHMVLSETVNKERECYIFGASEGGRRFIEKINGKIDGVFFVDSSLDKQGTMFCGCQVHGPAILKEKKAEKIFIASIAFFEIIDQLIDMNVIQSIADLMPYKGHTQTEIMFEKLFNRFASLTSSLSHGSGSLY